MWLLRLACCLLYACCIPAIVVPGWQVRDARISIADSDQGLVVTNTNKQKSKGKQAANADTEIAMRQQFLMAFDMSDWEEWKTYFRRQDCLMPHREPQPDGSRKRPRQQVAPDI